MQGTHSNISYGDLDDLVRDAQRGHPGILYFPIVHNALCLPPTFCINCCCEMLLGGLHISKSFTTIVYAKLGGQTECIMENCKIEKRTNNANY